MYRHLEFLRLGAVCALYPLYDPHAGAYSRENWCDLQPRQRGRPAGGVIGGPPHGDGGGVGGPPAGGRLRPRPAAPPAAVALPHVRALPLPPRRADALAPAP